jgi:hypothetical protein
LQARIISKVDTSHPTLTDDAFDFVPPTQDFACFKG